MNTCTFVGRLPRDAQLKDVGVNKVCNFSIASDVGFGDKKKTLWIECGLWGKRGEALNKSLKRGQQVTLVGELSTREYESDGVNKTATHISYCFAEVEGFSKFGTYEGNSSADGTFIATGFRPAWITLKTVDSANDWVIYDSKRDPINIADTVLRMDSTNSEYSGSGREIDILSNGFKMRTSNGTINASATFAYMAFAEFPLKYANAR